MSDIPSPATGFLFDTDTVSNLLRDRPRSQLISRLAQTPLDAQFLPSITLAELLFGAYKNRGQSARFLAAIESLLVSDFQVLAFDESAARQYGVIRAELEHAGVPIGDRDVQIASIALANDLTLVSANTRHFSRVPGLRLVNWLE